MLLLLLSSKFDLRVEDDIIKYEPVVVLPRRGCHLETVCHYSVADGPIWTNFGSLMQNRTPITVINVKNFHGSLTTDVRAQNDTTKTANITDTIFDRTLV